MNDAEHKQFLVKWRFSFMLAKTLKIEPLHLRWKQSIKPLFLLQFFFHTNLEVGKVGKKHIF